MKRYEANKKERCLEYDAIQYTISSFTQKGRIIYLRLHEFVVATLEALETFWARVSLLRNAFFSHQKISYDASFSYPCIHVKSAGGYKNKNTDFRETGRYRKKKLLFSEAQQLKGTYLKPMLLKTMDFFFWKICFCMI